MDFKILWNTLYKDTSSFKICNYIDKLKYLIYTIGNNTLTASPWKRTRRVLFVIPV